MSLTERVIKNTFYHLVSQIIGFIFPLIITPYILSKIGETQFGIYALVLGFIGTFGLFDLSVSTSFIKFISEYYNQKKNDELNQFISTGLGLYISFSLLFTIIGFVFTDYFVSLINVPSELTVTAILVLRIGLLVFLIATSFTIFVSILISIQKIYLTSINGIVMGLINLILTILFLNIGWGLTGLLYSQLITVILSTVINIIFVYKSVPELKIRFKYVNKVSFKNMFSFGAQMQVSRLAAFTSEKYDEFLLAFFSVLGNVTFFNLAGRISRLGRFLPFQIFQQIAPVAAELNAKGEKEKLAQLFEDATKYLSLITLPVFIFIFIFANVIIFAWMGEKYELTSQILRILVIGQIVNMIFSAPGNAIIPNIGIPKYSMHEGLINLGLNLIISFFLIKYYGILGAAIGNTTAIVISSIYVFYVSAKFYKLNIYSFLMRDYLKPIVIVLLCGIVSFFTLLFFENYYYPYVNRFTAFSALIVSGLIFVSLYVLTIFKSGYLKERDKVLLGKFINKIILKK